MRQRWDYALSELAGGSSDPDAGRLANEIEAHVLGIIKQHDDVLRLLAHGCGAGRDGECVWRDCPQSRDGEPARSGRHCPLDFYCGDPHCDAGQRVRDAVAVLKGDGPKQPVQSGDT